LPETGYIAVFLVGLLGGTHCMAMCGGIVGALTVGTPPGRPQWPLHLAYNLGRISSYALAGAVLGAIGSAGLLLNEALPVQMTLYVLANLMLVALGLYLIGVPQGLTFLERGGQKVWARIQPLTRRFCRRPRSRAPCRSACCGVSCLAAWSIRCSPRRCSPAAPCAGRG
jgi:Uncharacterized conserved protein